jgi:hypothetical protein
MRRYVRYSELTTLLDVLFILLFAALIQATATVEAADAARSAPAVDAAADASDAAPPPDATATGQRAALRRDAVSAWSAELSEREPIYARISGAGVLERIERGEADPAVVAVRVSLLRRVADPDIGAVYAATTQPQLRLCTQIRSLLGLPHLRGQLILFVPALPLRELPIALVEGLRHDQEYCYDDERGIAALIPAMENSQ